MRAGDRSTRVMFRTSAISSAVRGCSRDGGMKNIGHAAAAHATAIAITATVPTRAAIQNPTTPATSHTTIDIPAAAWANSRSAVTVERSLVRARAGNWRRYRTAIESPARSESYRAAETRTTASERPPSGRSNAADTS